MGTPPGVRRGSVPSQRPERHPVAGEAFYMELAKFFEHSPPQVAQLHAGISGFPRKQPRAKGWDEFQTISKYL
jgi:hypothetical protein